jgi:transmembrane sensor
MTATPLQQDPRLVRLEQAALWLQRLHAAGAEERLVEEWLEWCQRDPLNQQAFDEMAAVWEASGEAGGAAGAARSAGRPRPSRWQRRALVASLAGVALAGAGWWWSSLPRSAALLVAQYASPIGANTRHELADGSLLELGGATRVTVRIGARERRVELHEGELFVTVRRDTSRPFLVDTGRLAVVATGTAFNVQRTLERTTVTVAEGSVEARYEDAAAQSPNVQLQVSQQLVYSHAAHSVKVRQAEPGAPTWRRARSRASSGSMTSRVRCSRWAPARIWQSWNFPTAAG